MHALKDQIVQWAQEMFIDNAKPSLHNYLICYALQVLWSETGEHVCIATDDSFYILRYSSQAVDAAKADPELSTPDGIEDAFEVSDADDVAPYYL